MAIPRTPNAEADIQNTVTPPKEMPVRSKICVRSRSNVKLFLKNTLARKVRARKRDIAMTTDMSDLLLPHKNTENRS